MKSGAYKSIQRDDVSLMLKLTAIRQHGSSIIMPPANLILTAATLAGLYYIMKTDVRPGLVMLRKNMNHVKEWWGETAEESKKAAEKELKQLEKDKGTQ